MRAKNDEARYVQSFYIPLPLPGIPYADRDLSSGTQWPSSSKAWNLFPPSLSPGGDADDDWSKPATPKPSALSTSGVSTSPIIKLSSSIGCFLCRLRHV
jgi:hypothetical protein